jgi:hypothetical protein
MTIEYKYEITRVDETARCMDVVYSAEGHQTMYIGARLPYEGESLQAIVDMFSPVAYWLEQTASVVVPAVGESGTINTPVVETLESAKSKKLLEIAFWRYGRECSGININGVYFNTDRTARSQIVSAYLGLSETSTVEWKSNNSWITLDKPTMLNALTVIEAHVQQAFLDEKTLALQVNAAQSIAEVNAIEVV